jgi:hypothetical protein
MLDRGSMKDYRRGIAKVIRIGKGLGLVEEEVALLLGFQLGFDEGVAELQSKLDELFSIDVDKRIGLIIHLKEELASISPRIENQRKSIRLHQNQLGRSILSLMVSGNLSHLEKAVDFVDKMSDPAD